MLGWVYIYHIVRCRQLMVRVCMCRGWVEYIILCIYVSFIVSFSITSGCIVIHNEGAIV